MSTTTQPRRRAVAWLAALALPALAFGGLVFAKDQTPAEAANDAAASIVYDGSSAAQSAASCWEIKQDKPASADGVYWLLTDKMKAPEQFYCDMTTDGGGWVLIGRGRQGWTYKFQGQGTPAQVRANINSAAGFAPKQLSGELVQQLLGDQAPESLPDGYMARRATSQDGSSWQTVRFSTTRNGKFSWALGGQTPVSKVSVDGTPVAGGTLSQFGTASSQNGVNLTEQPGLSYSWGLGFTATQGGAPASNASSFIVSGTHATAGASKAIPMAQLYLRPQLRSSAQKYSSIPDSGTSAIARPALAESTSMATTWGASGRAVNAMNASNKPSEHYTEVQAFTQSGNTMFVGGNFKHLERDASGKERFAQSFLAAFDVNTRELKKDFTPKFDGQIKALATLPNNRIAVGGEFNNVNGVSSPKLVVLDATTGKIDANWKLKLTSGISSFRVRALSVEGNQLYIGGVFTHLTMPGQASVYSRGAARVSVVDGTPDKSWTTEIIGEVYSIKRTPGSKYVYLGGFFSRDQRVGSGQAISMAKLEAAAGAKVIDWKWTPSKAAQVTSLNYWAWDVIEDGASIWMGASEHILRTYDTNTLQQLTSNITLPGGDFQDVELTGNVSYGACHCDKWNYSGASTYPTPDTYSNVDSIDTVGAWNRSTKAIIQDFQPKFLGTYTQGVWAMTTDSLGRLWVGGDLRKSQGASGMQFSGGFATYAPRDITPPAVPGNVKVARSGTKDVITWDAASGASTYQVLRNDRPIASTASGTRQLEIGALDGARYFVRAMDTAGNVSASSKVAKAPAVVTTPPTTPPTTPATVRTTLAVAPEYVAAQPFNPAGLRQSELVTFHNTWSMQSGFGGTWMNRNNVGTSGWAPAKAAIGWNADGLDTRLTGAARGPFKLQTVVNVEDPSKLKFVRGVSFGGDGYAVWVNGKLMKRVNYPSDGSSWATKLVGAGHATAARVDYAIDPAAFVKGKNVISVQVLPHSATSQKVVYSMEVQGYLK